MKKTIRLAQTVYIPHVARLTVEVEEEEIAEFLKSVGIQAITEQDREDMRGNGIDFMTDDDMSVYTIADNLGVYEDVECEPDTWNDWIGSYNLWVEEYGEVKNENNTDNS